MEEMVNEVRSYFRSIRVYDSSTYHAEREEPLYPLSEQYNRSSFSKIYFDEKAGAIYINLKEGMVRDTMEREAMILIDIGEDEKVLGIEILFEDEEIVKALSRTFRP